MAKRRQAGKGEAYWRRIVRQQAASGGAIRDFCRRNKLRESTFYFWRRELQHRDEAAQRRPGDGRSPAPTTFVPASVAAGVAEPPAREEPLGMRRIAVGRNNPEFLGSDNGGTTAAIMFSLNAT